MKSLFSARGKNGISAFSPYFLAQIFFSTQVLGCKCKLGGLDAIEKHEPHEDDLHNVNDATQRPAMDKQHRKEMDGWGGGCTQTINRSI